MNKLVPAAATLGLAVLVASDAAPLAAANREHQQMMADIRMLQEQSQQLQLLLGQLAETLKTVTAKLDEQASATRRAFADQKALIDTLAGDVRVLREKIDDANVRISTLSQEIEALRQVVPPPGPTTSTVEPATGQSVAPTSPPAPGAALPGLSPTELYQRAYADYTLGQWALAIAGFEAYIKAFPRSPQADDAQFYIGQTYYADGKYKEAVEAYDRLIANYPDSDYLADAYYKRGVALEGLQELAKARESFETVLQKFPGTPAAGLAKQALDRLKRAGR
jgi:tol-pal system protein YbgF